MKLLVTGVPGENDFEFGIEPVVIDPDEPMEGLEDLLELLYRLEVGWGFHVMKERA